MPVGQLGQEKGRMKSPTEAQKSCQLHARKHVLGYISNGSHLDNNNMQEYLSNKNSIQGAARTVINFNDYNWSNTLNIYLLIRQNIG